MTLRIVSAVSWCTDVASRQRVPQTRAGAAVYLHTVAVVRFLNCTAVEQEFTLFMSMVNLMRVAGEGPTELTWSSWSVG